MIIDNKRLQLEKSESRLGFATTGGSNWKVWDRFITLDGEKLFHIGNICGTCAIFIQLKNDIQGSYAIDGLKENLNKGVKSGHWCFANYMLDGHHKIYAAALERKPITLIPFLTRDFSWQVTDLLIKHYKTIK